MFINFKSKLSATFATLVNKKQILQNDVFTNMKSSVNPQKILKLTYTNTCRM